MIWLTGHGSTSAHGTPFREQDTLADRISQLDSETIWAVTNVVLTDDGQAIAAAIRAGNCITVSDGSFKSKHGTASWVIEAESSDNRSTGDNITPGAPSDQSSYRSEVSGLLGIGTMVPEICAYHNITEGTIYIGCDGLSVKAMYGRGLCCAADGPTF
jgi:hypothetical protein